MVPASNGLEALNRLRSGLRVDAIVLDVMMPMMDGGLSRRTACRSFAARYPGRRHQRVWVHAATLQQQFNAYDVLLKPLELGGFLRALRGACRSGDDA